MILVAVPYHKQKQYSLDHLFDWIAQADLPNSHILLKVHTGPYGEKDAVKKQREYFRLLADRGGYSHLLFVGADTIPPLDVLPRLLAHGKDVVGGVYFGRHGATNGNPHTAVAWKHDTKPEDLPKQFDGSLITVDGMGMDCVLFSRTAFTHMSFMNYEVTDDDYPVYDHLKTNGFQIYLDTSLICKHYSTKDTYA